jgi:hypothetical protein
MVQLWGSLQRESGIYSDKINISNFKNGIYIIKVFTNKGLINTQKIIIQK